MNRSPQPRSARVIDFCYVSLLVALSAAGIAAMSGHFGQSGVRWEMPAGIWFSCFLPMQCFLLLWVANNMASRGQPWGACLFALRMQAQAAIQIFLRVYLTTFLLLIIFYMLRTINADPDLGKLFMPQSMLRLNYFLMSVCPVLAVWTTTWRLNALASRGYMFADIQAGALSRVELPVSAPGSVTAARLAYYLATLNLERTPALPLVSYGKRPVLTRDIVNGCHVHTLTWSWCPSAIRISVYAGEMPVAMVVMSCQLRPGYHQLDLFSNPLDALVLMEYVHINVLQLLASELALSTAAVRQDALRSQALEMQLRILQAQIEPHFLFNTLASVRHVYRSSTDAGELMMDHVIAYLRSTMQELRAESSTVGKEMDLILHYLEIMRIRMGERLSYSFIHCDDVTNLAFPPAMLISLVENAIKHGLSSRIEGKLIVSAVLDGPHLRVTVVDDGAGFSSVQGTGVGLSNIRQRLEALFGNGAWLEVGMLADGGCAAAIVVPLPDAGRIETRQAA